MIDGTLERLDEMSEATKRNASFDNYQQRLKLKANRRRAKESAMAYAGVVLSLIGYALCFILGR